ncbi:hypothetical protein HYW46_06750 [Candidatus Daviesbacteria bacterium]|nr:hypothetical protein [Candidatus Daviesbacteria bacterium]
MIKKLAFISITVITFINIIFTHPVYAEDLKKQYGFGWITSLGDVISRNIVPAGFEIAGIALLFYIVIAAIKYMTSGGDKEAVASARGMITHSVIGFLMLIFLFLFLQYILPAIGLKNFIIVR